MRKNGDLERIGADVEGLLSRMGMPAPTDLGVLVDQWERVVGSAFSGVCTPIGLRGGELTVEVSDGSAASLLKYRIGPLLDRLREHFGDETVARVKVRVAGAKKRP